MMTSRLEEAIQVVKRLSEDDQRQLLEWSSRRRSEVEPSATPARILDLHAGAMTMHPDFDAELSDE